MAEPLRATFYTFRRHADRGGVILGATLITGVATVVLIGLFILMLLPVFAPLFTMAETGQQPSSDALAGLVGGIFGFFLLALVWVFFFYVLFAAYEAACLRWMIRREAPGWFGLTLGVDTWRVYAGYWVWFAINMGVSMAVSIVTTPILFLLMVPASQGTDPVSAMVPIFGLQLLTAVLQYAVMIFVGVRFAPAAATSIARKRFAFFDAWKVTKGRFWALFGSFFVLMIGYLIINLIFIVVVFGALAATLFQGGEPTAADIQALFAPSNLALIGGFYALLLLAGAFYVVMSFGVNARAVIAAIDEGKIEGMSPNVAEVFS